MNEWFRILLVWPQMNGKITFLENWAAFGGEVSAIAACCIRSETTRHLKVPRGPFSEDWGHLCIPDWHCGSVLGELRPTQENVLGLVELWTGTKLCFQWNKINVHTKSCVCPYVDKNLNNFACVSLKWRFLTVAKNIVAWFCFFVFLFFVLFLLFYWYTYRFSFRSKLITSNMKQA